MNEQTIVILGTFQWLLVMIALLIDVKRADERYFNDSVVKNTFVVFAVSFFMFFVSLTSLIVNFNTIIELITIFILSFLLIMSIIAMIKRIIFKV